MKERPILFTSDMVRAILEGRKTQTRRPVMLPDGVRDVFFDDECDSWCYSKQERGMDDPEAMMIRPPSGSVGERLYVRETWQCVPVGQPAPPRGSFKIPDSLPSGWDVLYSASGDVCSDSVGWRPSIHMPRWASRINLEITAVRGERVQEINRGDAMEEGCPFANFANGPSPRDWFRDLWQSTYGNRPTLPANTESRRYQRVSRWLEKNPPTDWDANPFVWVYEFRRVK